MREAKEARFKRLPKDFFRWKTNAKDRDSTARDSDIPQSCVKLERWEEQRGKATAGTRSPCAYLDKNIQQRFATASNSTKVHSELNRGQKNT